MELKAYAKLNLILNVLGQREDGYHEIETLMTAISLFDRVNLSKSTGDSVTMNTFLGPKQEDNLAYKALKAMKTRFRRGECYNIYIEKNIPTAGGLGGGSADAAAVMAGLSALWEINIGSEQFEIAESLGSDVPFCLLTQTGVYSAVGRGRGEILTPENLPELKLDLKTSDIHINNKTASVYKALTPEDYLVKYDISSLLKAKNEADCAGLLGNHLQKPLERHTGKSEDGWILCGAGPTYFRLNENGEYKTIV